MAIAELEEHSKQILAENELLREDVSHLRDQNKELRERLHL